MTERIEVEIPVVPRVKGRPRTFTDEDGESHTVTPSKTKANAEVVKLWMMANRGRGLITGPVAVRIELYKDRSIVMVESVEAPPRVLRGDLDNYAKQLLDCGNGILYEDDRQIVSLTIEEKG